MAKKSLRPGRTLITFFIGVGISFALVALTGTWKPELGLDLQGGTRITLQATSDPTSESLEEARAIIDQRVNGSGVAEAEVTTEGGDVIAVEIPGDSRRDLVEVVERQAQLRFRLVGCTEGVPCGAPGAVDPNAPLDPNAPQVPGQQPPGGGGGNGGGNGGGSGSGNGNGGDGEGGGNNRPPVGFSDGATQTPAPSEKPSSSEEASPSGSPSDAPSESATTEAPSTTATAPVEEELAWMNAPDPESVALFNELQCSADGILQNADGSTADLVDDPTKPLVACSMPEPAVGDDPAQPSFKYLLSRAVIQGTDLESASSGIPQQGVGYVVNLEIGGDGQEAFTAISRALVGSEDQFAIVLDGQVISAPTMTGVIPNGQAQITGNFTEASAADLATSLKFGALPIAFEDDTSIDTIGPSLAGDQLNAGITAGAIGLSLVLLYCLAYYRGLGLVVVASLGMAAALTYSMVLLLSETAGFTLTLPGIAGLIIAVGITADSFIILFERIRDEMRDGKSMRVAVESGWARARNTCLAADAVSLLAAVVLYIFASGVVKGFAFALGLSTLIDLVVFFFFTKPMVSWLARFTFFNSGSRMSGLSAETLGMDAVPAGGKA